MGSGGPASGRGRRGTLEAEGEVGGMTGKPGGLEAKQESGQRCRGPFVLWLLCLKLAYFKNFLSK